MIYIFLNNNSMFVFVMMYKISSDVLGLRYIFKFIFFFILYFGFVIKDLLFLLLCYDMLFYLV